MDKIELKDSIITLINQEIHCLNIEIEHFFITKYNKGAIEAINKKELLISLAKKIDKM